MTRGCTQKVRSGTTAAETAGTTTYALQFRRGRHLPYSNLSATANTEKKVGAASASKRASACPTAAGAPSLHPTSPTSTDVTHRRPPACIGDSRGRKTVPSDRLTDRHPRTQLMMIAEIRTGPDRRRRTTRPGSSLLRGSAGARIVSGSR